MVDSWRCLEESEMNGNFAEHRALSLYRQGTRWFSKQTFSPRQQVCVEQCSFTVSLSSYKGILLTDGFTSRLANEPEPVPLKDDEHGRYHLMALDGYLIHRDSKLGVD
jgi:hypothetical protein